MGRLALWPVQSRYPTHKNQNHRIAWHYVFGSVNSEMADFCGFQSLRITPSVEDGFDRVTQLLKSQVCSLGSSGVESERWIIAAVSISAPPVSSTVTAM